MSGFIQVPVDGAGKRVDTVTLSDAGSEVHRQKIVMTGGSGTAEVVVVTNAAPSATDMGMVVRHAGTATVTGVVTIAAGAANIGFINNISAVVAVSGQVSLGPGTSNIGTINNISAAVVLAAGANNIGTINNISAAVVIAAGSNNIGTINNISANVSVLNVAGTANIGAVSLGAGTALIGAVSLGAGTANIGFINNISAPVVLAAGAANIGFINNISATVNVAIVAGTVNIGAVSLGAGTALIGAVSLAAGTSNIGSINNISAVVAIKGTVNAGASVTSGDAPIQHGLRVNLSAPARLTANQATFAWGDPNGRQVMILNHPCLLPTASHGPKCVIVSTSATVALVAAPGAGLCVYITKIACTNGSATLTRADVYQASATASAVCQMYMAASGGGFTMDYNPPIQLLSNTAANARVKPNVSQAIFNIHFFVGAK